MRNDLSKILYVKGHCPEAVNLENFIVGCKPICLSGEVPPRQERTKENENAGANRAGTACRVTDTKPIVKKPDEQAAGIRKSLLAGCSVQECRDRRSLLGFKGAEPLCRVKGETPCPKDVMLCVISYWVLSGAVQAADLQLRCTALLLPRVPLSMHRTERRDDR